MVRKSEVFVEYEPGSEMPLPWARALAGDLRRSGRYRAVKVSKSRAGERAVAMGRVWVDQGSSRATGCAAATGEQPDRAVGVETSAGNESDDNGEVA